MPNSSLRRAVHRAVARELDRLTLGQESWRLKRQDVDIIGLVEAGDTEIDAARALARRQAELVRVARSQLRIVRDGDVEAAES